MMKEDDDLWIHKDMKKAVVANLKYHPTFLLEDLCITTRKVIQEGRNSNRVRP
jgi:hypothetical protein